MKNNQKNTSLIGILILSYNSIKTIGDTIQSVLKIADQIIVVDSGSVDGTIELATKMGCEIYFRKWTDNFAEQRNFALNHMRTDWILMLDSDEYISNFDLDLFKNIIEDNKVGGINFKIKNYVDNSNALYYHRYTRMFRNEQGFKFEGKIHEQIKESIENKGYSIFESDFEITHTGYSEINEDKLERNLKMLVEEGNYNPNDDFVKYHLASTYFAKSDLENAENIFLYLLSSNQLSIEQKDWVNIRLAQINLRKDKYEQVEQFSNRIPQDENLKGLRNYILSAVKLVKNDFNEAFRLLNDDYTLQSTLIDKHTLSQTIESLRMIIGK